MKSILDPTFHYVPSVQTDVRKTFARIRKELKAQGKPVEPEVDRDKVKVIPLRKPGTKTGL